MTDYIRDWVDRATNFSGGSMVGLATLTILGLAIAEYCSGSPTYITGPDGKNIIYIVHRAPEWFTSAVGVYTIILTVFAMSKPINTLVAQKGTPPPCAGTDPGRKADGEMKDLWQKLISLKWMNTPGFLAQAGHALLGILVVVWPRALFDTVYGPAIGTAIGTALLTAYMIRKETHTDPAVEDEGFWPEGAKDCAFAALGNVIAWLSLWAAGRI